ncbi:MAG: phosphoribosylamine--glycine ligase [Actinomycetaceae bacterium]|nr:phosphoribosylamine--glycine ligase [Actinomycetaceae bacterium]MDY5854827.1 phosphoribosylamine--glycine ligase [Arcanobacterium sp.]
MKILIVGGGGREMALVAHEVERGHDVWCAGASDAIAELATPLPLPDDADPADRWDTLADAAAQLKIDLTIVGPEAPLATGIADVFAQHQLAIFAPTQEAARIETSKAYAKDIMARAGVPTAEYRLFTSKAEALEYLTSAATYPSVLKENGLRAGKGVTICTDVHQAQAVVESLQLDADQPLLVEEFLEGFEFSLIVMAAGTHYVAFPLAQDHKPIGEGNVGPNTGGMGAISPVPRVTDALYHQAIEQVIEPTLAQLATQGNPFTGFLYAGLIATAEGVKVIEFNARLGDPEAEVILPRLSGDVAQAALSLLAGETPTLTVTDRTCLGIVLSSPGYPGAVTAYPPLPAALFEAAEATDGVTIIHMGTQKDADGGNASRSAADSSWHAHGGRVAIVTALGANIDECRATLVPLLDKAMAGSDLYYRRDIGTFAS